MSFEFRPSESIRKGVRRVVRKQLAAARESLDPSNQESIDERIHSARKCFKRVRAVLRLVRSGIAPSDYKCENEAFRDAARPLSDVRDAKVLIAALDALRKGGRKRTAKEAFAAAEAWLKQRERQIHE